MRTSVLTEKINRQDLFQKVFAGRYSAYPYIGNSRFETRVYFLARDETKELERDKLLDSAKILTIHCDDLSKYSIQTSNKKIYQFNARGEKFFIVYPFNYTTKILPELKKYEHILAKSKNTIEGTFYIQYIPKNTKTHKMKSLSKKITFFNLEGTCLLDDYSSEDIKYLDKGILSINHNNFFSIETLDVPVINVLLKKEMRENGLSFDMQYK